jgi:hypothetical protein
MIGKPVGIQVKHEEFVSNKTGNKLKSAKISKYMPAEQVTATPEPRQQASPPPNNHVEEDVPW